MAGQKIKIYREDFARAQEVLQQQEHLCETCRRPPGADEPHFNFCARCRNARYCSEECQRKDWEDHKYMCAVYAATADGPHGRHNVLNLITQRSAADLDTARDINTVFYLKVSKPWLDDPEKLYGPLYPLKNVELALKKHVLGENSLLRHNPNILDFCISNTGLDVFESIRCADPNGKITTVSIALERDAALVSQATQEQWHNPITELSPEDRNVGNPQDTIVNVYVAKTWKPSPFYLVGPLPPSVKLTDFIYSNLAAEGSVFASSPSIFWGIINNGKNIDAIHEIRAPVPGGWTYIFRIDRVQNPQIAAVLRTPPGFPKRVFQVVVLIMDVLGDEESLAGTPTPPFDRKMPIKDIKLLDTLTSLEAANWLAKDTLQSWKVEFPGKGYCAEMNLHVHAHGGAVATLRRKLGSNDFQILRNLQVTPVDAAEWER